jgi:hypothetical protein
MPQPSGIEFYGFVVVVFIAMLLLIGKIGSLQHRIEQLERK